VTSAQEIFLLLLMLALHAPADMADPVSPISEAWLQPTYSKARLCQ
jgi:hypothetical protein